MRNRPFLQPPKQPIHQGLSQGLLSRNLLPSLLAGCSILASLALIPTSLASAEEAAAAKPLIAAGDLSLEELMEIEVPTVYGASKHDQKVTEAPSSISVITADEIKKYGYRTLGDILRGVSGLYVTYDRRYEYLGVRGLNRPGDNNSRVLVLVDGQQQNDSIIGASSIGTEFIYDIDLIERIEVIRGPSSSLYGSNAFFGVINIVSRQGKDIKGVEMAASAGSQDTYKGRMTYGDKFANDVEILLSGSEYSSGGAGQLYFSEYDNPLEHNGIANNADGDKTHQLYSVLSYHDLSLTGAYNPRDKQDPTGAFFTLFGEPGTHTIDETSYLSLNYRHWLGANSELSAHLAYHDYHFYDNFNYLTDPPLSSQDNARGNRWEGELQYSRQVLQRHQLTLGVSYHDNYLQTFQLGSPFPFDPVLPSSELVILDQDLRSSITALYAQDEFRLLDNLLLNAGLRYDNYSTFGEAINPRLGLIYTPLAKTIFKLLYGTAFRAPSAYELAYNTFATTPPSLQPEEITTYELVYEQYLGDHYRASVSGFDYQAADLITLMGLDGYQNATGGADALGVETELEGQWAGGLRGQISYTYQEVRNRQTDDILSNSPRQLAKLKLTAPLLSDKLFISPEFQYTGSRLSRYGATSDGFVVANLTLFRQDLLLPGMELSASAYNLFDTQYDDPVSDDLRQDIIRQDGRTFRLKLSGRF